MAVSLPNGATIHIASAYTSAKNITAASNAAECVITCTAHGFSNGDFVEITSGWSDLNGGIFRISSVTTDSFKLEGINTANVLDFPAGAGIGQCRKINTWVQLMQILEFGTEGGEQQFVNYSVLEEDIEHQIPTVQSAINIKFSMIDDPDLIGYKVARDVSRLKGLVAMRILTKSKSVITYNGYLSMNEMPTMTKNEVMKINLTYALSAKFNRYQ